MKPPRRLRIYSAAARRRGAHGPVGPPVACSFGTLLAWGLEPPDNYFLARPATGRSAWRQARRDRAGPGDGDGGSTPPRCHGGPSFLLIQPEADVADQISRVDGLD
uniref:Predicted protein n=1 Tax=Hordeum vulgare subsp. vulgare TaxID=112509 RepID=F2E7C6_HORVV|nr:predicted protein [Hordeum vulgare subsp. vulgare]